MARGLGAFADGQWEDALDRYEPLGESVRRRSGKVRSRPVAPWVMFQAWRDLFFASWRVPPEVLRPLVPSHLALDLFDGDGWVTLVPMKMETLHLRGLPPIPGMTNFAQINCRTYVSFQGEPGLYFFSIDAAACVASTVAQHAFQYPYLCADIAWEADAGKVTFRSERAGLPGVGCAGSFAASSGPSQPAEGSLSHFLAERYVSFSVAWGMTWRSVIEHEPWTLQAAEGAFETQEILAAAGLEGLPEKPDHLAYAASMSNRIWAPMIASRAPGSRCCEQSPTPQTSAQGPRPQAGGAERRPRLPWLVSFREEQVLFLHWSVERETLQSMLPPGLEVDPFDNRGWISLVCLDMTCVRPRMGPVLPGFGHIPQVGLRTYVRGSRDDAPSIYYLQLLCGHRGYGWLGQKMFSLPYQHADVAIAKRRQERQYRVDFGGADGLPPMATRIHCQPTGAPAAAEAGSLAHFLHERYSQWTRSSTGALSWGYLEHEPWPLQTVSCRLLETNIPTQLGFSVDPFRPELAQFASIVHNRVWPFVKRSP